MEVTRVDLPVETRAPTGRTNAYVVGADPALLVDPAAADGRLDALADERAVGAVAVTHHHPDHVGAVERYADRHDATVWARVGRRAAFRAATGAAPDRTFADGTRIETGDGPVRVLDTPGHAPEHVGFLVEDEGAGDERVGDERPGSERAASERAGSGRAGNERARSERATDGNMELLCGDLAVAEGSVVVGAPGGDMRAYLTALRRVYAMDPSGLRPGHGPAIEGADVRATVERLIDHRLDRERRVHAAVEGGARTVAEVRDAAYDKDLTGVRDLAGATVRAHLEKLAVEGALRWEPRSGRAEPVD